MTPPLKVFLSSPSDVKVERHIAERVLTRLRKLFAGVADLQICQWEYLAMEATAGYQDQIPDAGKFDIVVILLWSRLGTPLGSSFVRRDGTRYASGTEYEYERAIEAHARTGQTPRILVYRKTTHPTLTLKSNNQVEVKESVEQYAAVQDFFARRFSMPSDQSFTSFASEAEFEQRFERQMRGLIEELVEGAAVERRRALPRAIADGEHPYRGLARFEAEDELYFFGRSQALNEAFGRLRAQAAEGRPFLLIFGKSGVGKSSFVRAGLAPLLTRCDVIEGVTDWRRVIFEPSDSTGRLLDGLAAAVLGKEALPELCAAYASDGGPERVRQAAKALADALENNPKGVVSNLKLALSMVAASEKAPVSCEGRQRAARVLLLIDPVEEVFTRHHAHDAPDEIAREAEQQVRDRESFFRALRCLIESGLVWVVGTVRNDFFERCTELADLRELMDRNGNYALVPPSEEELGQIIRQPADLAGLEFDPALEGRLVADAARHPEALPLLSFTLDELHRTSNAHQTRRLSLEAYRELGGIQGAICTKADQTLGVAEAKFGNETPLIFDHVFHALIAPPDAVTGRSARLYRTLESWPAESPERQFVELFHAARLFMFDSDDRGEAVVTVTHEALLSHWAHLRKWIEDNNRLLSIHERLKDGAAAWSVRRDPNDESFLIPSGLALEEARELRAREQQSLEADIAAFISASEAAVTAAQSRRRRATRIVTVSLSLLALAASCLALLSWFSQREAERQTVTAEKALKKANRARFTALDGQREAQLATLNSLHRSTALNTLAQNVLDELPRRLARANVNDPQWIEWVARHFEQHFFDDNLKDDPPAIRAKNARLLATVSRLLPDYGRALKFSDSAAALIEGRRGDAESGESVRGEELLRAHIEELRGRQHNQLGHYAEAERAYRAAQSWLANAEAASSEADRLTLPGLRQQLQHRFGELLRHVGRYGDAERELKAALGPGRSLEQVIAKAKQGAVPGEAAQVESIRAETDLLHSLGELALNALRPADALRILEAALKQADVLSGYIEAQRSKAREMDDSLARLAELDEQANGLSSLRADCQSDFALALIETGCPAEARDRLREVLTRDYRLLPASSDKPATARYKLARARSALGDLTGAENELDTALASLNALYKRHHRLARCLGIRAELYLLQDDFDQAFAAAAKSLEILEAIFQQDGRPMDQPYIARNLDQLAAIEQRRGHIAEGHAYRAKAEAMKARLAASDSASLKE